MHKIIIHLLSIGFYIWGAVYCYDRGLQLLDLVLKEYEEYYWHDLEVRRIELATVVAQSTAASNEILHEGRTQAADPSYAQIRQNIIEQKQIYNETIRRIDAEKEHFMRRSKERKGNAERAYHEAYIPIAVVGGLIWYLLSLPLCGLLISLLSIFSQAEMTTDRNAIRQKGH